MISCATLPHTQYILPDFLAPSCLWISFHMLSKVKNTPTSRSFVPCSISYYLLQMSTLMLTHVHVVVTFESLPLLTLLLLDLFDSFSLCLTSCCQYSTSTWKQDYGHEMEEQQHPFPTLHCRVVLVTTFSLST